MDDITPPPAVLAYLNERARSGPDGLWFSDDAGRPHLDLDAPGCPNAGPRAVAEWTKRHRPDLWASNSPETVPAPTTTSTPAAPLTMTSAMSAIRSGTMTEAEASAAVAHHLAARTLATTKPDTPAPINWTTTMAAARQGDASALARLNAHTKAV